MARKPFVPRKKLLSVLIGQLLATGIVSQHQAHAALFTPANTAELIAAIDTANNNNQVDIIELNSRIFTLSASNNTLEGPNGLPVIESTITIQNGTIERSSIATTEPFRLLHVSAMSGDLTLNNVTLRNGQTMLMPNTPKEGAGGALINHGAVAVNNSTISNNRASYYGGGLYNDGLLSLSNLSLIHI